MMPMLRLIGAKTLTGGVAVTVIAAGVVAWWWTVGVDLGGWVNGPPPHRWASLVRQERRWQAEGLRRPVLHEYVPLEAVSLELLVAIAVSEDARFLDHGAVDKAALWDAAKEWWAGGRLRGASTISQQLARVLFLTPERSLPRKLQEWKLAWWLERKLGKRRVLELYVNVVEFGPGVFGAEAAARRYFNVSAACLDAWQAAALAAAVPAPGLDHPAAGSERGRWRQRLIAERAAQASRLRQRLAALAAPSPPCHPTPRPA